MGERADDAKYMKTRAHYFRRDGTPIEDVLEWGRLFGDLDYRFVAQDTLPNGRWVATIWEGLNQAVMPDEPPLIFETTVFSQKKPLGHELEQHHSATEAEALLVHRQMTEKWK